MTSTATYRSYPAGYQAYLAGCRPAIAGRSRHAYTRSLSREISYSDKIYARLSIAGHVIVEFTRDKINDFSTLLLMLRAMTPTRRGLARLTVRNMTRGWRMERPLMLYPEPGCTPEPVCPMPYDTH